MRLGNAHKRLKVAFPNYANRVTIFCQLLGLPMLTAFFVPSKFGCVLVSDYEKCRTLSNSLRNFASNAGGQIRSFASWQLKRTGEDDNFTK